MSSNISISIGENRLSGWRSGEINSSLLTLADSFSLTGYEVFSQTVDIKADDECVVEVAGEPIITGYIDNVWIDTDGILTLEGRDKTRSLVDCESIVTSFLRQSVLSIVQGMSTPFEIEVSGDHGPIVEQFVVAQDEKGADAINRLLTNYGMIITSDKNGNVTIREPGNYENPGLAFKEGVNIRHAKGRFSGSSRFSSVKVFGQNFLSAGFSAEEQGASTVNRPKRVFLADEVNQSDCQLAAQRMRDYTNGNACQIKCSITTLDYLPAGTVVSFESETLGVSDEILVESVQLKFDPESTGVYYDLVSPEKYGGDSVSCRYLQ